MRQTSAALNDVWPESASPTAVSARVSHVVQDDVVDLNAVIREMHTEMMQRTKIFVIAIVVVALVLMQRINRLEQKLMMHSFGADPRRRWW